MLDRYAEDVIDEDVIESPAGYETKLILRCGSAVDQTDNLRFDAAQGVSPVMARMTGELGGLALFPFHGQPGGLLVQGCEAWVPESEPALRSARRAPCVPRHVPLYVVQDVDAISAPWSTDAAPSWRVRRPAECVRLMAPLPCEILGVVYVASGEPTHSDRLIVSTLIGPRSERRWRLRWSVTTDVERGETAGSRPPSINGSGHAALG